MDIDPGIVCGDSSHDGDSRRGTGRKSKTLSSSI